MKNISVACKFHFNYPKIQDEGNSVEIKPYQVELDRCRLDDVNSVMRSVNEIRSDLESLKMDVYNLRENDTDHLRKKMYDMEEKITHFRDAIKQELMNLLRDEMSLSRDLQFMERRLEEWGKAINGKVLKGVGQGSGRVRRTSNNPAVQFQRFLSSSGGHCGGWEEQDHLLFLRERNKFKGKEKFVLSVQALLPDLSCEEIEEHEKWYQKYEELRNSQKEAIQKWRTERETQLSREKQKAKVEEEKKPIRKTLHQQINITERIKEWKNQKLLIKLEEAERQKREKERLKEDEKRRAEMHRMKKLALTQYKAEKLRRAQETLPRDIQESLSKETKVRNNILLKSFRLQDLQFIEKKKVIRLQIESKANEKVERWRLAKPALELIFKRDPQRIFQPTFIWSRHCLEAQKREKITPVFDLNAIPRLAVPEWRKELK